MGTTSFPPYGITEVRYVEAFCLRNGLVNPERSGSWPPEESRDRMSRYCYPDEKACDMLSPNLLLHLWHHPHHASNATFKDCEAKASIEQRCREWICRMPNVFQSQNKQPAAAESSIQANQSAPINPELGCFTNRSEQDQDLFTVTPKKIGSPARG